MTKAEARQRLDSLNVSPAQAAAARRTITRATKADDIEISVTAGGDLIIRRSRPGRVFGYQVLEDTIKTDGSKQVTQWAYDDAGNPIHRDPKGGAP
jgi:YD repeat-containing protein